MIEEICSNAASSADIHQAYRQALTQERVLDAAGTKRQLEREDALFEREIQERKLALEERKSQNCQNHLSVFCVFCVFGFCVFCAFSIRARCVYSDSRPSAHAKQAIGRGRACEMSLHRNAGCAELLVVPLACADGVCYRCRRMYVFIFLGTSALHAT